MNQYEEIVTGTYNCNATTKSKVTYSGYILGNGFRTSYLSTEFAGSDATVVITSIDSISRTIKGTFSATLTSSTGISANTKVITNGVINAGY